MIAAVLAFAALGTATADAQGRLEPGEWERSNSTEIPGSYMGPLQTTGRDCYTSADTKIYADKDAWAADMLAAPRARTARPRTSRPSAFALSPKST